MTREQILNKLSCEDCESYRIVPETLYEPEERRCLNGAFGSDYMCHSLSVLLTEALEHDELNETNGYYCTAREAARVEKEEGMDYGVDWKKHPIWFIFYDASSPVHFDSVNEIWRELL